MKAREICEAGKAALRSGKYKMVRINFANPDMVGHTGNLAATTLACALCDTCVKELVQVVDEVRGGAWTVNEGQGRGAGGGLVG